MMDGGNAEEDKTWLFRAAGGTGVVPAGMGQDHLERMS